MDKLAEQLKSDARQIDALVSDDLERRIDASLRATSPIAARVDANAPGKVKLWWASSLTGATIALLIFVFADFSGEPEVAPGRETVVSPVAERPDIPVIEWQTRSAMLTSPLRKELQDLQSDVRRAEQIVRREIGL